MEQGWTKKTERDKGSKKRINSINSSSSNNNINNSEEDAMNNTHFVAYWQILGKVVTTFMLPIMAFTVLLALRIDGAVTWSYWIIFSPLLATLLGFLLATSSQALSAPVPTAVRLAWILWVISAAVFVIFLILDLEGQSFITHSPNALFIPLYAGLGMMLLAGFYLFLSGCCCAKAHQSQKKYVMSATPIFCFSVVAIPLIILLSFKEGVDRIPHISWMVIFTPLFVLDAFSFCMGFFLLVFSFGSKDTLFSITQLLIFLVTVPSSVSFKILLCLYLDKIIHIPVIYVFVPLLVLEVLLFTCGLNVISTNSKRLAGYTPINSSV